MKNSLKEKVRYWFEFLNLAHLSPDPVVASNLRESIGFYSCWGNYRTVKFDSWWRENVSILRDEEADVLASPKVGDVVTESAFYVRIPFTYSPSTVGKIVAEKYARELEKRTVRAKKVKRIYGGAYSLTREDYPVAKFRHYLVFVRDVYLPLVRLSPRLETSALLERSRVVFSKISPRSVESDRVPFTNVDSSDESDTRLVRRYKQMAEKLLRNVSAGVFPGSYEETFVRTQAKIRAKRAVEAADFVPKASRGARRGVSTTKKQPNADDPFANRKTRSDKGKKRGSYGKPA